MGELDRIRWHCRRGMLELDLMLARFSDRHLRSLSADELDDFRQLLEFEDDELWRVLLGRKEPDDGRMRPIVTMIRET